MYTARLIVTVLRRHLSLKQKRLRLCPDRCHERAGGMPSSRSHYRSWTIQTLRDRLVSFNAIQIDYKQNLTICFQQYRLVTNSSLLFQKFCNRFYTNGLLRTDFPQWLSDCLQTVRYGLISSKPIQYVTIWSSTMAYRLDTNSALRFRFPQCLTDRLQTVSNRLVFNNALAIGHKQ